MKSTINTVPNLSQYRQYIIVMLVVAFYWSTSITMTFANKYLVGDKLSSVRDISLFVAWAQCVLTVVGALLIHWARKIFFKSSSPSNLPPIDILLKVVGDIPLHLMVYIKRIL